LGLAISSSSREGSRRLPKRGWQHEPGVGRLWRSSPLRFCALFVADLLLCERFFACVAFGVCRQQNSLYLRQS
jgi:hypothetical protein